MVFVRVNEVNEVMFIRYNYTHDLNEFDVNKGIVLDIDVPTAEDVKGKYPIMYYDKEKNELYYGYKDLDIPVDETSKRLNELENALIELASMLGGAN